MKTDCILTSILALTIIKNILSQDCLIDYQTAPLNILKFSNRTNDQLERTSLENIIDFLYSNISFYNLDISIWNKNVKFLTELKLSKNDLKIVGLNLAKNLIQDI